MLIVVYWTYDMWNRQPALFEYLDEMRRRPFMLPYPQHIFDLNVCRETNHDCRYL